MLLLCSLLLCATIEFFLDLAETHSWIVRYHDGPLRLCGSGLRFQAVLLALIRQREAFEARQPGDNSFMRKHEPNDQKQIFNFSSCIRPPLLLLVRPPMLACR